jgi:hypothetical protein
MLYLEVSDECLPGRLREIRRSTPSVYAKIRVRWCQLYQAAKGFSGAVEIVGWEQSILAVEGIFVDAISRVSTPFRIMDYIIE